MGTLKRSTKRKLVGSLTKHKNDKNLVSMYFIDKFGAFFGLFYRRVHIYQSLRPKNGFKFNGRELLHGRKLL